MNEIKCVWKLHRSLFVLSVSTQLWRASYHPSCTLKICVSHSIFVCGLINFWHSVYKSTYPVKWNSFVFLNEGFLFVYFRHFIAAASLIRSSLMYFWYFFFWTFESNFWGSTPYYMLMTLVFRFVCGWAIFIHISSSGSFWSGYLSVYTRFLFCIP